MRVVVIEGKTKIADSVVEQPRVAVMAAEDIARKEQPDILGMSALLTTTMPYMKVVIDTMKEKGLRDDYIVLVGGAPLNEEFGKAIGADAYCRDAAVAVETAKQFVQMQFQPQQVVISGTYSPWLQTWEGAWNALTGSAQSMVIATAALLPWVIVLGGLLWVIVAIVRTVARIRRRSQVKAEATAAAA